METRDKDQVVYYYNREKRLEKASANARFMVDHYGAKRPGIIRSLTATRSLRYLFFAVGFMAVALLVVNYVIGSRDTGSVAGYSLSAKAMWFEGYVYITVKKNPPKFGFIVRKGVVGAPIGIKAGDGLGFAVGTMQAGEDEIRLRFSSEARPPRIAVIASASRGSAGEEDTVELVARVE